MSLLAVATNSLKYLEASEKRHFMVFKIVQEDDGTEVNGDEELLT